MRILVIEDELKLAKALQEGLEAEQYGVALAYTPARTDSTWSKPSPSI